MQMPYLKKVRAFVIVKKVKKLIDNITPLLMGDGRLFRFDYCGLFGKVLRRS